MKKILLLLILIGTTCFTANATHLMGGEIVVGIDSTNTAHFVMTLYRDNGPSTAMLSSSQTIQISSVSNPGMPGTSLTLNRVSVDTLPSFYPVERHIYVGSLQLSATGKFRAEWSLCCRNHAIVNASNPGSESMTLYTEFTTQSNQNSASPVFLNAPVVSFPLDTLWNYNPLPYDVDGDSLHWSIDTPVSIFPNYIAGYSTPPANANGSLTMDPQTGQISWSPSQVGNYVISLLVEEYRGGVQIGEIRRDMQFVVVPDTASMQLVLPNSLTVNNGIGSTDMTAGITNDLTFELKSSYSLAQLSMSASGDPFEINGSNADFQVISTNGPDIEGTFSWNPTLNNIRKNPYRITIRASDKNFVYDFTVLLNVSTAVGIDENIFSDKALMLYPNPSNGKVNLMLKRVPKSECIIEILDMQGKVIEQLSIDKNTLSTGTELNINAAPGTYIMRLQGGEYNSEILIIK